MTPSDVNAANNAMRLVVDTNIVVSALLWGGPPRRILDAARVQQVSLYTSPALLAELDKVLARAKLAHRFDLVGKTPAATIEGYRALATLVAAEPLPTAASRDPDDDHVIACAIAARAEIIVSGDRDLLDLGRYGDIRILSAATVAAEIEARRG